MNLGTKWVKVDIICPLLFVINDGKQGEQICGRFVGHSEHTVRHHHSCCDCVYDEFDNPDVACSFLDAAEIKELCMVGSAAELKALSMYRHCTEVTTKFLFKNHVKTKLFPKKKFIDKSSDLDFSNDPTSVCRFLGS